MKAVKETFQSGEIGDRSAMNNDFIVQDDGLSSLEEKISVAAYYRAEQRGFVPGNELEDWLHAEADQCAGRDD